MHCLVPLPFFQYKDGGSIPHEDEHQSLKMSWRVWSIYAVWLICDTPVVKKMVIIRQGWRFLVPYRASLCLLLAPTIFNDIHKEPCRSYVVGLQESSGSEAHRGPKHPFKLGGLWSVQQTARYGMDLSRQLTIRLILTAFRKSYCHKCVATDDTRPWSDTAAVRNADRVTRFWDSLFSRWNRVTDKATITETKREYGLWDVDDTKGPRQKHGATKDLLL